jgi:hypothetical protein
MTAVAFFESRAWEFFLRAALLLAYLFFKREQYSRWAVR